MTLKEAVAQSFALLEPVADFFPRTEALKSSAMKVWVKVLGDEGVTAEELQAAITLWFVAGEKMPKPATILRLVRKTDSHSLITDPVKTGEHDGVEEIGSRALCDAKGLPYILIEETRQEALPTPEQREDLRKKLERAESKVINDG